MLDGFMSEQRTIITLFYLISTHWIVYPMFFLIFEDKHLCCYCSVGDDQNDANTSEKNIFWHFLLILFWIYKIQIVCNQEKLADLNFKNSFICES